MWNIIKYEEITNLILKDGTIISVPAKKKDMEKAVDSSSFFIHIWDESINKTEIARIKKAKVDDLENFILSQSEDIRNKLREKHKRLKKEMNKEMSLEYAKNFVQKKI